MSFSSEKEVQRVSARATVAAKNYTQRDFLHGALYRRL